MTRNAAKLTLAAALVLAGTPAVAANQRGAELTVLVDGRPRPEYPGRGTVYVEALKGREYALEIRNPYPYRVAVALSVDGLNTIDARHTDPWTARKWVLEPYGRAVIEGWQVSDSAARRFYFTNERDSYGAMLGQTQNLGVIEAVFYRERAPRPVYRPRTDSWNEPDPAEDRGYDPRRPAAAPEGSASGAPAPRAQEKGEGKLQSGALRPEPQPDDDYAATGMGDRTRHDVYRVDVDLERSPVATLRLRYEYRPQLAKMGLLPRYDEDRDAISRRERSRGFEGSYAPEPRRSW